MSEWKEYTIGEICSRFSSGKSIKASQISDEGLYPVYGGNGLRGFTDTFNFDGECSIIGRQGAYCGNVRYFKGKAFMTEHAIVAVVNENHNNGYVSNLLSMMNLAQYQGQSAQPGLSVSTLSKITIKLPDLATQEECFNVLNLIDQKIQINNQINQELEAMAKTLYDYWFVQFDFPDQNGNPYKSSGGKMVYNPELKREIPKGWGVASIRDFESNIITGKTPSRTNSDNFGGEIPFITIGDIRGNTYIYRTSETLTDLGASVQKNKYLPEESLCVSCIATVGEIGFTTEPSHTNQQINSIVFEDETNRYYLYFALKNYFENANVSAKTGNTFANMNKEDFSGIKIIFPNKEIKNNFHKITEPYFSQIKCLQGQNQQLTQLRDWLLPMLMNGQVII